MVPAVSTAQTGEKEGELPESGILYPRGFDANTVGEVTGRVAGLVQPGGGPVRFQLTTEVETYTVLACPAWYWNDLAVAIPDGTEVRVKGSKTLGKDGNLYIIAEQIEVRSTGKTLVLRSDRGAPLWRGSRMGTMRGHGGAGPSQGGVGGGPGGRGRGRR